MIESQFYFALVVLLLDKAARRVKGHAESENCLFLYVLLWEIGLVVWRHKNLLKFIGFTGTDKEMWIDTVKQLVINL